MRFAFQAAALMVTWSVLLVGCTSSPKTPTDEVTCRLKWYHHSQFAGFYAAEAFRIFEKHNIACTLVPGGLTSNEVTLVLSGSDDFGVTSADQILIARSKGMPVKCVAVLFRKSPVCFFSKRSSGIKTPLDFVGKRVAMQYGTNVRIEYVAMMSKLGIDLSKVDEVPTSLNLQSFLEDKVDVWNGYVFNEPCTAREKGYEINIMQPSDYGVSFYSDCIFTTEETINRRPDVVRRFVSSVIEGWTFAFAYPDSVVAVVLQKNPQLTYQHEANIINALRPLILDSSNQSNIGQMSKDVWAEMYQELEAQHVLGTHQVDVSAAYSTSFLPN